MAKVIKKILFRISLHFYAFFYQLCGLFKTKKRAAFISYRQMEDYDNYYYLQETFRKHNDYDVLCVDGHKNHSSLLGLIRFTIKSIYYMRTSNIVIIDDYFLPMYVIKKKHNKFFMLWHASGAFKRFGNSITSNQYGLDQSYKNDVKTHTNYDLLFASGEGCIQPYQEAFDVDENIIKTVGLPRIDYFYHSNDIKQSTESFYQRYPSLKNKKLILFAPTFRGKGSRSATFSLSMDFKKQVELLDENTLVIYKKHPFVKSSDIVNHKMIVIDDINTSVLMQVSDCLITDYSSVIYEYSLLNKPIYLYTTDLETYEKQRNFYFDLFEYKNMIYTDSKLLFRDIFIQNDPSVIFRKFIKNQAYTFFDNQNSERVYQNIIRS